MADIVLPPGAFAAAKAGAPQPTAEAKPAAKAEPVKASPKAAAPAKEPEKRPGADEPPANMTAAEKKIWKLKADGEEFEFDATDEEAVKREIMKARGADKKFQTAAQLRQQAEKFFDMLKNPATLKQVLSDPRIGLDVKKFAEEQVWEALQQQQREEEWKKDPAKKEQWDKEQRLKAFEDKEAADKAKADADRAEQESSRFETGYNDKILKALEVGGIPKSPAAVARMAEYLMIAIDKGYDLTPEDLVAQVREDYLSDFKAVLGDADGDQLLAMLGEANAKKLREADLKRLKSPQSNPFPQRSQAKRTADAKSEPAPKRKAGSDWKNDLVKEFLSRKK